MTTAPARAARAAFTVLGLCALLAGCGGGGGDDSSSNTTAAAGHEVPQPSRPVTAQVPVFEQAASSLDCADALRVVHPVVLVEPDAGQSKQNCAAAVARMRRVQGFKATGSKEFGT